MSDNPLIIDNVSSSESDSFVSTLLNQTSIVLRDLVSKVRDHRNLHWSKSTLLSRLLAVLQVSKV
jgi:hypothetical protein